MPALKHVVWLGLLAACEGPTLYVGDLDLTELDAGESDASAPDAGRDARVRDAQGSDGRVDFEDYRCGKDDDCRDPRAPRCNTNFYFCTGCQFDRDCLQDEYCDTSFRVWQCKDGRKDDPGPSMGGGP
ncbi:MAG TPA: hypothetical protein VFX59_07335 [Polyangiales bacterium]|nr:hypothetical protein [Polyangiales bacterium]